MTTRPAHREPIFKPGMRFHGFVIVRLLGMGGVAEVYEALYKGKRCALKVLQRRFHLDRTQMARADQEATVLTRIRHLNVIDVHEAGVHDGIFWMRMEFVEGIDLRTAIHSLAPMSVGLAGAWLVQAAYGAHQCHAFGVIHRDIKPENIYITRQNIVKLIDLGIAKMYGDLTTIQATGDAPAPVGTAPYMSPEQARGQPVTPGSDVYALAITFWEAVVGEHPFLGDGAIYEYWTMVHQQVSQDVPLLSEYGFPDDLSNVVAQALSKRWQDRQPSALAFAKDLIVACNRYVAAHPEESHPGEPAVMAILDELRQPPSFGTGPMAARRSSMPRPRKPRTANGLGPSTVVHSILIASLAVSPRAAPPSEIEIETEPSDGAAVEVDPSERVTDVMPPPVVAGSGDRVLHRFQTVPMPPEQRGRSAAPSLATYGAQHPATTSTDSLPSVTTSTTAMVLVAAGAQDPPSQVHGPATTRATLAGWSLALRRELRRLGLPALGLTTVSLVLAVGLNAVRTREPLYLLPVPAKATTIPAEAPATAPQIVPVIPASTAPPSIAPEVPAALSASPSAAASHDRPHPAPAPAPAPPHDAGNRARPRASSAAAPAPAPPPPPSPAPATPARHRVFGTED